MRLARHRIRATSIDWCLLSHNRSLRVGPHHNTRSRRPLPVLPGGHATRFNLAALHGCQANSPPLHAHAAAPIQWAFMGLDNSRCTPPPPSHAPGHLGGCLGLHASNRKWMGGTGRTQMLASAPRKKHSAFSILVDCSTTMRLVGSRDTETERGGVGEGGIAAVCTDHQPQTQHCQLTEREGC